MCILMHINVYGLISNIVSFILACGSLLLRADLFTWIGALVYEQEPLNSYYETITLIFSIMEHITHNCKFRLIFFPFYVQMHHLTPCRNSNSILLPLFYNSDSKKTYKTKKSSLSRLKLKKN